MNNAAPGNLGLRDIILALDWIQENIEDYGGDKSQVTIFGHSAGSMAISALLTTQQASFNRAILQAGTLVRPFFQLLSKTNITQVNYDFSDHVGCSGSNTLNCMQDKTVEQLVSETFFKPVHQLWEPVIDDILKNPILPVDPYKAFISGQFKDIDLIIGSNSGDGISQLGNNVLNNPSLYNNLQKNFKKAGPSLMLGRNEPDAADIILTERLRYYYLGESILNSTIDQQLVELMSDNMYQAGGRTILEILALFSDKQHYQYYFDYVGTNSYSDILYNLSRPELGACHGDTLLYIFAGLDNNLVTDEDKEKSYMLTSYWTNFAKSGNVNGPDIVTWDQFTLQNQKFLHISSDSKMEFEDTNKIMFWRNFLQLPQVTESSAGLIQGSYKTSTKGNCILSFQGVPYAKPPIGNLRFLDPVVAESWEGVLDATSETAKCFQFPSIEGLSQDMSEDCLYLNIYTPCTVDEALPVMVWIHGGDYKYGDGGTEFYGPEYLIDEEVILVTIQYRLVPFGFISLESSVLPGNQGLKDQKLALQWIQDHIESFGGNKNEVTLFGQNAGSQRKANKFTTCTSFKSSIKNLKLSLKYCNFFLLHELFFMKHYFSIDLIIHFIYGKMFFSSALNHMSNIFSSGLFSKVIAQGSAPGIL